MMQYLFVQKANGKKPVILILLLIIINIANNNVKNKAKWKI